MKRTTTAIAIVLAVAGLSSCATNGDNMSDHPADPVWLTSTSPTGRKVECLWTSQYGGLGGDSYQAEMQCWEVGK